MSSPEPSDGASPPVPRALLVHQHLPHYRRDVFVSLQGDPSIDWSFATDLESRDASIPAIPLAQIDCFYRLRNHWFGPALWQAGLIRLLLRRRFDAVVFQGDAAYVSTWVGALLCRAVGTKVLFWTIGWHRPEEGVRRLLRMVFYRTAHMLLLYEQTAWNIGVRLGYPAGRLAVIGNSASIASTEAELTPHHARTLRLPPTGTEVVTAVVRLNPRKGLDLLVRAAAVLSARGRPVSVLLVGAGPAAADLSALAQQLGVDVYLPGPTYSAAELTEVYLRTAVTVVPLAAGLTCIQSLAHGTPVITTDDRYKWMPESAAIEAGTTGGFYADGSVDDLASCIEGWLDRVARDPLRVEQDCKREARTNWTPEAHGAAITRAVVSCLSPKVGATRPTDRPSSDVVAPT